MTAPGDGFRADPAVIEDAATGMAAPETTMQAFGEEIAAAVSLAAGAAGEGPLADVLGAFGPAAPARADERAREPRELAQAMRDSAEQYRERDGEAAGSLDAVPFGG